VAAEVNVRAKREKHFAGFADRLLEQVKVGLQQEQKEIQELKTRWRQQRQKQKQVQAALPCVPSPPSTATRCANSELLHPQQRAGHSELDLVSINERTVAVNSAVRQTISLSLLEIW
jgi:hypothetical protein